MVKIQAIFIFSSYKNLPPPRREEVKNLVAETYNEYFPKVTVERIQVTLADAAPCENNNDIVFAIDSDERKVENEGMLRGDFAKAIAKKLGEIPDFQRLGYRGKVNTQSGLASPAKSSSAPSNSPNGDEANMQPTNDATDYRARAAQYQAQEPRFKFEQVQLSDEVIERIKNALGRIKYEHEIFEEWGLKSIANPVSALSFYGPPGTGKSMAAEAIADYLGKKIIRVSYADIENKYVGEGPKNASAVFLAAEQQDAVLFLDEAESLLSKRMVNVSDPSGQAMNSMRSQILICLEKFHGVAIFATNLAVNYDKAFASRLINIKIDLPDADMRGRIWHTHLRPEDGSIHIPLSDDVDEKALGEKYELCGREIRNAVVDACVDARRTNQDAVNQECLCHAAEGVIEEREKVAKEKDQTAIVPAKEVDNVPLEVKENLAKIMNKKTKEQNDAQKGENNEQSE